MREDIKEAIETLRYNLEYITGRFLKDDGSAADDEFRMSLDAMKEALTKLKEPKCKTCGDTQEIEEQAECGHVITGDCPDCTAPEQPPAGELKLDECNIYLMNSELCLPLGDFKAKIMIMCPNQDVMDKMEEHLKKCDRLDRAEAEIIKQRKGRIEALGLVSQYDQKC